MAQKLQLQQLRELGPKLESPPASKDALVKLLKQATNCLSEIEQSPLPLVLEYMQPCLNALAKHELLKHQDRDVKVLVATCICEITRITAPEAPYSDEVLRDIFHLIVGTFNELNDISSPSFGRRVLILETLARYRSCVVMLDLDCNDLINEMFHTFFTVVSDNHPQSVLSSMQTIMVLIVNESEDIQENLLSSILSALGRKRPDFSMAARKLAMNVVEHCAGKLEPCIKQFLVSSLSDDSSYLSNFIDHHEVIFDLFLCAPQILTGIVPYMTGELLTDKLDIRAKAVELLGELFALPEVSILEPFQPLFSEFLKRLTDRVVQIRVSVIGHLKNCLMSNPSRPEAPQIIRALCDRLLDYDENVRKQVVIAFCDVACHSFDAIPVETVRLVAERLRDKSLSVKKYTMERLVDLYRFYCVKNSDNPRNADDFEWIPGKILKCLFDKDFRPEDIELILCGSLFPTEFSIKDRTKHWVTAFARFDKVEVKALEQILVQKQRLQQEMQKYLSLRQTQQEEAPDLQKRVSVCFRSMSRLFNDPAKAEENLNTLNQLKDVNIWKLWTSLVDPAITFSQSRLFRDDLLKILGERHPLYDFMSMLSIRCSYLLINKEYVKEILCEVAEQKTAGNVKLISSCMNFLTVIACFFPLLVAGSEEHLVHLLKEDNATLKEGIAHVLAKAGGTIRELLATTSSSIDLILERLCLEGSRKQAKYSVHALAAITKDDGLKSLSVLYKRLVDMLDEKVHLPSILESLGCIAHVAMPIFETREEEIIRFIHHKILECPTADENSMNKSEWGERTELCLLKIYGIKTLVKSYLPSKDAHARSGIEKLIGILRNILSYGDITPDVSSSAIDKANLRLAAAKAVLRLSRQWDQKIPVDVFYLTLRISQDTYPQSRKLFLSKVHQYIKERVLDAKYACAFLLNINDYHSPEYEECKHDLLEVVQICHQVKLRQLSVQADANLLVAYPEYIIAYLIHALAHDPSCPNIEKCTEIQAFEPIYWRLHLILSVLLVGDEVLQPGSLPKIQGETFATIVSILHSVKSSQDQVNKEKTKTLHAICDLALMMARRLFQDQKDNSVTDLVPLPTQLFTDVDQSEKSAEKDEQTWSCSEKVLAHFEALMSKNKVTNSGDAKDELMLNESDGDGNEVPLGKMLKFLRAHGAKNKKKKVTKKHNTPSGLEDGILEVVREINLDSSKIHDGVEMRKPSKDHKPPNGSQKRRMEKTSIALAVPKTPKRKRSVSAQRPHLAKVDKESTEVSLHAMVDEKTNGSFDGRSLKEKDKLESPDSNKITSKAKKHANESYIEKHISNDLESPTVAEDSNNIIGQSRSLNGSVKKRKRRSISGLAKCSSHSNESNDTDLVGSRIKVWWPLDQQFYEGVIQSYDSGKRKHVILYDDGDVEVLNLGKEKWELVSDGYLPLEHQKINCRVVHGVHGELSHDKANESTRHFASSPQRKSAKSKPSERKGAPRKRTDAVNKIASKQCKTTNLGDIDAGIDSDTSNTHSRSSSEREASPSTDPSKKPEEYSKEETEILEEQKPASDQNDEEESDDEPLSSWRLRTAKVT